LASKTEPKKSVKLAQVSAPDKEDGARVSADTTPSLCVNKGTCAEEKSDVSYGPYKATNGYLRGHGQHIVFDQFGNVDNQQTTGYMRPLNVKVTKEQNY
jgi:hypothetical protein